MALSRNLVFTLCLVGAASLCLAQEKPGKATAKPATKQAKSGKKSDKPAKEKKAESDDKAKDEKDKKDGGGDKPVQKMSVPLPEGHDSHGIVIPYTDASGQKTMNFRIGVGRKVDGNTVKMSNLVIEMYDAEGRREMLVDLPSATLDLPTRVIRGDKSVTVKRDDFEITGREMEFDTESRKGWIKGEVKMIIQDLTGETAGGGEDNKEENPEKVESPKAAPAVGAIKKAEAATP